MAKAHGIEMKPGDVHYVVGAKEVYRALTGDMEADSPKARRWLREKEITVHFLPQPVDALALAGLLHIAQFVAASVMANRDVGVGYTTSPRDRPPSRQMRPATARMLRAYDNHVQMIGLFAAATLLLAATNQSTAITATAAWTYLAARALYVPANAFGWQPWRSYIWIVALAACAILFLAALVA